MLTAYVKNYGSFWFAQVLENDHYRGSVRRATKRDLLAAVKYLFPSSEIVEVK